jgi:WD40 repeat protein
MGDYDQALDEQPLELEHAIGYTGRWQRTLLTHPGQPNSTIFAIGCTVVLGKLDDPHDQEFLRGHDEELSCLTVARTGQMIASGQVGSSHLKEPFAPVIVWDYGRREEIYFLKGLLGRVICCKFSPDSRFLAATDTEGNIIVWSMETGLLATTVKHCPNCSTLEWGNIAEVDESRMTRHAKYMLITAHPAKAFKHVMEFDVRTMQYEMTTTPFMLPSMGLKRVYTDATITPTDEYLMLSTQQGDFAVFNIPNMIYRSSVPVSSNGVLCVCQVRGDTAPPNCRAECLCVSLCPPFLGPHHRAVGRLLVSAAAGLWNPFPTVCPAHFPRRVGQRLNLRGCGRWQAEEAAGPRPGVGGDRRNGPGRAGILVRHPSFL